MRSAWPDAQAAFAAALIDPVLTPPRIITGGVASAAAGFGVHRNNSIASLIGALQERFPVTRQLVGEEFFRAMARSYASRHQPRSPLLLQYGDDFPAFIDVFTPADDVPYLADVARLEAAWSESYHAADAHSLQASVLIEASPSTLLEMRLLLHPSVRILRSAYPIAEIWAEHQSSAAPAAPKSWKVQDVLVVRPEAHVEVRALGPGVHAFVSALLERRRVQDAAEAALNEHARFDLGRSIVDLFDVGAVIALDAANAPERVE